MGTIIGRDGGMDKRAITEKDGKDKQIKVMGRKSYIFLVPSCCSELWVARE